uniref:Uncharacterized protein n=1 Tax=Tanacetum cinerariifolium TaxID=118510 RepID=A0A699L0G8_TANCI|nr:hypothetical protein [Tanacetum cinerariifolium]
MRKRVETAKTNENRRKCSKTCERGPKRAKASRNGRTLAKTGGGGPKRASREFGLHVSVLVVESDGDGR